MHGRTVALRNYFWGFSYRLIARPLLFAQDPEKIHDRMLKLSHIFGKHVILRKLTRLSFSYSHPYLHQNILGIDFSNPIGLAAGFDKDAVMTQILPEVGFGWEEIGSITGKACKGNQGTRLWRLKQSKSILVYYGLKNEGAVAIAKKLKSKRFKLPICASIAKTNDRSTADDEAGIKDYVKAFSAMEDVADLFTINISCPNAYGGQPFTDGKRLGKLLSAIDKVKTDKPVFIKLSPDLDDKTLYELLAVIGKHRIHGIICSNLTKSRDNSAIKDNLESEKGGMSGKVVEELANQQLEKVYRKTKGKYVLVGLGGVFTAEDAYKKIKLGASLVQLITGMIYEGPQSISEINRGLVKLLKADGYSNISEAVGVDVK